MTKQTTSVAFCDGETGGDAAFAYRAVSGEVVVHELQGFSAGRSIRFVHGGQVCFGGRAFGVTLDWPRSDDPATAARHLMRGTKSQAFVTTQEEFDEVVAGMKMLSAEAVA